MPDLVSDMEARIKLTVQNETAKAFQQLARDQKEAVDHAKKGAEESQKAFKGLRESINDTVEDFAKAGAALASFDFMKDAVTKFAEVQRGYNRIAVEARATGEQMKMLDKELGEVAKSSSAGMVELEANFNSFRARSGLAFKPAIEAFKLVAETADATGTSIDNVARATTAAVKSLKVPADDINKVLAVWEDTLPGSFDAFAEKIPGLAQQLNSLGKTGTQNAMDISAVFKAIETETNTPRQAASQLQKTLADVQNTSSTLGARMYPDMLKIKAAGGGVIEVLEATLKKLHEGQAFKNDMIFKNWVPDEDERKALKLLNEQWGVLIQTRKGFDGALERSEKAHKVFNNDAKAGLDRLKATWEDLTVKVGASLDKLGANKAIEGIAHEIEAALERAEKFSEQIEKITHGGGLPSAGELLFGTDEENKAAAEGREGVANKVLKGLQQNYNPHGAATTPPAPTGPSFNDIWRETVPQGDPNGAFYGGARSGRRIPKLASGGDIASSGLAYVHEGETVVPAQVSRGGSEGSGLGAAARGQGREEHNLWERVLREQMATADLRMNVARNILGPAVGGIMGGGPAGALMGGVGLGAIGSIGGTGGGGGGGSGGGGGGIGGLGSLLGGATGGTGGALGSLMGTGSGGRSAGGGGAVGASGGSPGGAIGALLSRARGGSAAVRSPGGGGSTGSPGGGGAAAGGAPAAAPNTLLPWPGEGGGEGAADAGSGGRFASFGRVGPKDDPRGMVPHIRAMAQKYGIDPDAAVAVAKSEGLSGFKSGIPGENSFGAFQLNDKGMGAEFQKATGLDPSDPRNERATIDYAMKRAAQIGNWGPWHGAKNRYGWRNEGIGKAGGATPGAAGAAGAAAPTPTGRGAGTLPWPGESPTARAGAAAGAAAGGGGAAGAVAMGAGAGAAGAAAAPGDAGAGDPNGIIDYTRQSGLRTYGDMNQVKGMLIHHTGGLYGNRGPAGLAGVLNQRGGLSVQYFIGRDGKTYRMTPEGKAAAHAGNLDKRPELNARNMEGVEIEARNDKDVLEVQQRAAARLVGQRAQKFGYDPYTMAIGHGEATRRKEPDEGATVVQGIRNRTLPLGTEGAGGAAAAHKAWPTGGAPAAAPAHLEQFQQIERLRQQAQKPIKVSFEHPNVSQFRRKTGQADLQREARQSRYNGLSDIGAA